MPRNRVVTPEAVADTVEQVERPFVTTVDVAERLDVTKQAIRNHHSEFAESGLLEHGKVGRQTVYWLPENGVPEQAEPEPTQPPRTPERDLETEPEPVETNDTPDSEGSEGGLIDRLPFGFAPYAVMGVSTIGMLVSLLSMVALVVEPALYSPTGVGLAFFLTLAVASLLGGLFGFVALLVRAYRTIDLTEIQTIP